MEMFLLLLLLNAVQYSSCERFNIVPSPDSPCPGEFTGEPCLTLQQYVANPSLNSNITFELHPGNHRLDSQLSVSNINSFTMRANSSATVTCNQQLSQPFYFNRLQQIHVSGITFVGCRMQLGYIVTVALERNSFVNRTRCCESGAAFHAWDSSVLLRQCIISNNRVHHGAIYSSRSTFIVQQTTFTNNFYPYTCCSSRNGGAMYSYGGNLDISNSNFNSNHATNRGHGGAIYTSNTIVTIINTYFSHNRAGNNGHGGAVYFDGGNITITNSTFINNRASAGGGGAIYSARRYTNISLVNNLFRQNTAAYCGVMAVAEFYHYHINITGNTFIYNRAIQQISGNNGGGVICIRNASMLVLDNNFSHNSAAGNAGVIQVDESDIIIERSIFSNNTAGGNGGVLQTYFYPTRYTIIDSSFTYNQAGGDGGVMYIGRAGSHVTVNQSTFSFNNATNRGGVIAIVGSTLEIDRTDIFENAADVGAVISACNSQVTITNPELLASQDPIYSFCFLYDSSNTTISRTTAAEQTTSTTGTNIDLFTAASTTTEGDTLTTTTLPPTTNNMIENTTTTVPTEEVTTTTEDTVDATTTVSTTEDIDVEITTTPEPMQDTTTTTSATVTDSETTTSAPTKIVDTTISSLQEVTSTNEDIIMTSAYEEASTTEESIRTITPPQTIPPETSTKPESSTAAPTTTGPIVNPVNDEDQDTANYNFHYILPGYVSIGVSAIVLLIIAFFGVLVIVIAVKVFQVKTKSQNVNLSAYEYPTVKNEYSLPDVHVAHT